MIRTILLAEDDKSTAFLVRSLLQKQGYNVFVANNGLEALQLLHKHKVDLVVTDVVMPHMDGVDLYDELKKREDTQHIPVIIITDKQMFKDAFSALGVEHFVSKSEDINLLLQKIKSISDQMQKKEYRKILISGSNKMVLDQMQRLLVSKRHLVTVADNSADTIHKAFLMSPHVIILDLRMNDTAQTREMIHSLRCYHYFHNALILTYAYLSPDEMSMGNAHWQVIENEARACQEVGEAHFIGNFSQVTFLRNAEGFLHKPLMSAV